MNNSPIDNKAARSQLKKALAIFGGLFLLMFGVLIVFVFRDGPPPEDAHLMPPAARAAVDPSNPLTTFTEDILKYPIRGLDDLPEDVREIKPGTEQQAQAFLDANADPIRLWNELLKTDAATWRWPIDVETNDFTNKAPYLEGCLKIASVVGRMQCELLIKEGKNTEAAAHAINILRYGKGMQSSQPFLTAWVSGLVNQITGLKACEKALSAPQIDAEFLHAAQISIQRLECSLYDFDTAWRFEYFAARNTIKLFDHDTLNALITGSTEKKIPSVFLTLFKKNKTISAYKDIVTSILDANRESTIQLANVSQELQRQTSLSKEERHDEIIHPNGLGRIVIRLLITSHSAIIGRTIGIIALNRMSVINLAMRQFELKYKRLPDKLDELVPEFINAVPADPFDGNPIRWDKSQLMFYSIGVDQSDNGGEIGKGWGNKAPDLGMYYWWSTAAVKTQASDESESN